MVTVQGVFRDLWSIYIDLTYGSYPDNKAF